MKGQEALRSRSPEVRSLAVAVLLLPPRARAAGREAVRGPGEASAAAGPSGPELPATLGPFVLLMITLFPCHHISMSLSLSAHELAVASPRARRCPFSSWSGGDQGADAARDAKGARPLAVPEQAHKARPRRDSAPPVPYYAILHPRSAPRPCAFAHDFCCCAAGSSSAPLRRRRRRWAARWPPGRPNPCWPRRSSWCDNIALIICSAPLLAPLRNLGLLHASRRAPSGPSHPSGDQRGRAPALRHRQLRRLHRGDAPRQRHRRGRPCPGGAQGGERERGAQRQLLVLRRGERGGRRGAARDAEGPPHDPGGVGGPRVLSRRATVSRHCRQSPHGAQGGGVSQLLLPRCRRRSRDAHSSSITGFWDAVGCCIRPRDGNEAKISSAVLQQRHFGGRVLAAVDFFVDAMATTTHDRAWHAHNQVAACP